MPDELFYPNKADRPWRYIVLHHSASTAGNYDEIDREHRKLLGYEGCGYHFVIGNGNGSGDGQIEVAQRWNNQKQGVHCRNARSPRGRRVRHRHLPGRRSRQAAAHAPADRRHAGARGLPERPRYRIEPATCHDPRPSRGHAHGLPGKYFPATVLAGTKEERAGGELTGRIDDADADRTEIRIARLKIDKDSMNSKCQMYLYC